MMFGKFRSASPWQGEPDLGYMLLLILTIGISIPFIFAYFITL